eukprot:TRINITY_DN12761_c0_g1_i3.p1 TRINITY_DN12761_c0_g1~~TRINITY_DN12761_c0_g1_i3.p1  ORF type:complete len:186 (-),score=34.32 TRINITY_DN12761_c0_g1_i3:48-545(-)
MCIRDRYKDNLGNMKLHFFILDRLVDVFIPEIGDHLRAEKIDSSLYSPAWLLTIFTNTFQYSKDKSHTLFVIWDRFLIEGVKALYKVIIYIFDRNKEMLLKMGYDEVIRFMHEITKMEFFSNNEYRAGSETESIVEDIKHYLKETKIPAALIHDLEKDFLQFHKS